MISGSGTHIFSENSFTVMLSLMMISCFFTRLPETPASFTTFGVAGVAGAAGC